MFQDRRQAGKKLALKLKEDLGSEFIEKATVLSIPRGGIVIGKEICDLLNLPLDFLIIKKIPAPGEEELAVGAMGEDGVIIWEEKICRDLKVPLKYKQQIVKEKVKEFERKEEDFRSGKPFPELKDRRVVIVDDGIATGATMRAAVKLVRNLNPKEIIIAVPIISPDVLAEMKRIADRIIYLEIPEMFFSVDQFYDDFSQLSDEEARKILKGES